MSYVPVYVISVMVGSCLPVCWFLVGFLFVPSSGGVSFKLALPVLLARAYDWIFKSSLAARLSLTALSTHTLICCYMWILKWLIAFILYTGVCVLPFLLRLLGDSEHIVASCSEGLRSTCPHRSASFPCFIPLCLSSSTFICHHPAHTFPLHIHTIVSCTT